MARKNSKVSDATKAKMKATWAAKRAAKEKAAKGLLPKSPLVDDALFYLRKAHKNMKAEFKAGRKDSFTDQDFLIHIAIRCLEGEKI